MNTHVANTYLEQRERNVLVMKSMTFTFLVQTQMALWVSPDQPIDTLIKIKVSCPIHVLSLTSNFRHISFNQVSLCSSVGIVINYGLEDRGVGVRALVG
jgi:hypothetical protein